MYNVCMAKGNLVGVGAFLTFLFIVGVNSQAEKPERSASYSTSFQSSKLNTTSENEDTAENQIIEFAGSRTVSESESSLLNSIENSDADLDTDLLREQNIDEQEEESAPVEESIVFDTRPKGEEYLSLGRPRTAILRAARAGSPNLKGTEFYSPAIVTDGDSAFLISEAREKGNFGGEKLWVVALLTFSSGTWKSEKVLTTLESSSLSQIAEKLSSESHDSDQEYDFLADLADNYQATRLYQSSLPKLNNDVSAELYSSNYTSRLEDIRQRYETALEDIGTRYSAAQLSYARSRSQANSYSEAKRSNLYVNWEYKPHVAENGSYYGQISSITHLPKTISVSGYYRRDGTYVRGHYRSRR